VNPCATSAALVFIKVRLEILDIVVRHRAGKLKHNPVVAVMTCNTDGSNVRSLLRAILTRYEARSPAIELAGVSKLERTRRCYPSEENQHQQERGGSFHESV